MSNMPAVEDKDVTVDMQNAWIKLETLLSKQYLPAISRMAVGVRQDSISDVLKNVRIDKINRILYDKSEDNLGKFTSIFTALHAAGGTFFVLLHNEGRNTEIFLGVKGEDAQSTNSAIETLQKSLNGNFPGITIEEKDAEEVGDLSDNIRADGQYVACVSGVPSLKEDSATGFFQGLEKIIDAMGEEEYTALFLASPISGENLDRIELAYQNIYSCLSSENVSQISLTAQDSVAYGDNFSQTLTKTLSESLALSNTVTESRNLTNSFSKSTSEGFSNSISSTKAIINSKSFSTTNARMESSSTSHSVHESTTNTMSNTTGGALTFFGGTNNSFGGGLNFFGIGTNGSHGMFAGMSKTINTSFGVSRAKTSGTTDMVSTGTAITKSDTEMVGSAQSDAQTTGHATYRSDSNGVGQSEGEGYSRGQGQTQITAVAEAKAMAVGQQQVETKSNSLTHAYAVADKHVAESLKRIDEQLARIRDARNYGAWNWAGYFIAKTPETARNGANIYTGILSGKQTGIERTGIVFWDDAKSEELKYVKQNLARFEHPLFMANNELYNVTSLISTPEAAVAMSLPQKALPGIPVYESTQFGRAVTPFDAETKDSRICHIGHISHLDTTTSEPVHLNFESLASHTFITGSTGSGKSNAINLLLARLRNPDHTETDAAEQESRIHFLVIEPAKGEYRKIWSKLRQCNIWGTNPEITRLLKVNPFSFPEGIHVMEHIDRLVEILNAVWPMYAAMPAILKDAIEQTYQAFGWNLVTSKNEFSPALFPDFFDLLKVLPKIIDASKYSDDTKGNYTGALVTRIRSLTNGYYRLIFQKKEIDSKTLFDENTIVDLSRVGSSETKALITGILFLKLQEYRMAQNQAPNQKLRHVTILEEAHHLLRRTSLEQNMEIANLQGKSVEMLTNAIAEMRTYGEGFIIADQAPYLLDPAVIRNTNTKIVFRLPDYEDRELVGKAQHLNKSQIEELARLRTGCAAVYQNNWQEAVLCQFDVFSEEEICGKYSSLQEELISKETEVEDSRTAAERLLLKYLLAEYSGNCPTMPDEDWALLNMYYPQFTQDYGNRMEIQTLWWINEVFVRDVFDSMPLTPCQDRDKWIRQLQYNLRQSKAICDISEDKIRLLFSATFKILAEYAEISQEKERWLSYVEPKRKEICK